MNKKRLLIASTLLFMSTCLLFITKIPTSSEYPLDSPVLSVLNTSLETLTGQATSENSYDTLYRFIKYQFDYEVETDQLSKNVTLIHQLSVPIEIENSVLPKECSYDFELTITCSYQEESYYVKKHLEMTLAYERDLLNEGATSKVIAYANDQTEKTEGKEKELLLPLEEREE